MRLRKLLFVVAFLIALGVAGAAYGLSRTSLPPALPQQLATTLTDANGVPLATLSGAQNRQPVTIDVVRQDPYLIDAVVATEDHTFFHHHGIDPASIVRAAVSDLLGHGSLQGASTLTQQYIKNAYLGQQRTLSRKLKEAVLSLKLERKLTKYQILERYLNTIYWGRGAYGIEAAAQAYFHKDVQSLTLAEAAFLAGAIRAPEDSDPVTDAATAKDRRDISLDDMAKYHYITAAQAAAAKQQPVEAFPYTPNNQQLTPAAQSAQAGYFVSYVTQKLISTYGADVVYGGGLKVKTSLDLTMQQKAYNAVYTQVLVSQNGPAGGLISLDNSGAIKAMVGGRDYSTSKVNLTLGSEGGGTGRQPGSTMKAVLLAEMIKEGWSLGSEFVAPPQIILHGANTGGADWTVSNFGNENFAGPNQDGTINLIQATANSVNTVYAQAVVDVTPHNMVNMAADLGLKGLPEYPSIVLGTVDESMLNMAAAYAVFADNGVYIQPHAILSVTDSTGSVHTFPLQTNTNSGLTRQQTDLITYVLQQVVLGGTGTGAGFRIPVAGKTGTTSNNTDAWFIGYTPQPGLITAVWMGYPNSSQPMQNLYGVNGGITGGTLPADMFRRFMSAALVGAPTGSFDPAPAIGGRILGQPATLEIPTTTTTSTTVPGQPPASDLPDESTTSTTSP